MASLRREGVDGLGEEGMDMIPKRKELDTSAPNFSQHSLFEHTYPWVRYCCCCCEFLVFLRCRGRMSRWMVVLEEVHVVTEVCRFFCLPSIALC